MHMEYFPQCEPMHGARDLVTHFKRHNVTQAVATSSMPAATSRKTERHQDMFASFHTIVQGDDPAVRKGKPAPDIFLEAAVRLGADPISCLVFEDAKSGVMSALAAGMTVVAVPDQRDDVAWFHANAHEVLPSLRHFDPAKYGLPSEGWTRG
eukprot:TRINITY_DN5290_c0_g1_i1.p2 TRINITY_DN5290_c0_g1~~TRINITY_DN5290_c0_g1_i1.p2  ORF type:complete len:152 (+),score=22.12 TRINITY_DN5290_c0_g1_i1:310-765(+)